MSKVYEVIVTRQESVSYTIAADNPQDAWDKFCEWSHGHGLQITLDLNTADSPAYEYSEAYALDWAHPEDADIK